MKKEENNEHEFLKELSPLLFEKRIVVNQEPPVGYFENLTDKIIARTSFEETKRRQVKSKIIQFVNIKNLAIAAGIALIIALVPFFSSQKKQPILQTSAIAIDSNTEIADLNEYLSESDLYSAFDSNEILYIPARKEFSDYEIINYLMYEDYSEDLLTEIR